MKKQVFIILNTIFIFNFIGCGANSGTNKSDENLTDEIREEVETPDIPLVQENNNSVGINDKIYLKKTGETVSYQKFDDGYYQIGTASSYSRIGEAVIDNITKLQWQDDTEVKSTKRNWNEAKNYCSNLSMNEYKDWRLPTIDELKTLIDYSKYNPALDSSFKNEDSENFGYSYWSSTSYASASSEIWSVDFYQGTIRHFPKRGKRYTRCVR